MAPFFELLPSRADSERSWTLSRDEIEARNFDLKAVNPNARSTEDTWTPEELLDIIEAKGREVDAAIQQLKALQSEPQFRRVTIDTRPGRSYARIVDYRKRIKVVTGKRGGQPTIRGLRITVSDVLSYLAAGMTEDQILEDFPDLQRDDIRAALAYAADRERQHAIAAG